MDMAAGRLQQLCETGNFDKAVRILSSERLDPQSLRSVKDKKGWGPLHYACQFGDIRLITILVEDYSCDPECKTYYPSYTPLHLACRYEFSAI